MDNIYSCLGEKSGGISVSNTGLFCFVRGGVVFFCRTPFRLFPPLSLPSQPASPTPPLPFDPFSWFRGAFLSAESTVVKARSDPYNRTRSAPRESRGRLARSEELEETHKHPSVEACLQLATSSIAVKLQGVPLGEPPNYYR